ncbi:unnamed protein product [Nippostrongylus brasiliensis]|uniref:GBBH-like_N domain-containing protein n=1 Tax=Nippostrongylus brasiliensis TaxID=27835 RepID=A0A0N4YI47_NIPBR|nr:unnamed protein product [Nippostrongylus brasiliensis]
MSTSNVRRLNASHCKCLRRIMEIHYAESITTWNYYVAAVQKIEPKLSLNEDYDSPATSCACQCVACQD